MKDTWFILCSWQITVLTKLDPSFVILVNLHPSACLLLSDLTELRCPMGIYLRIYDQGKMSSWKPDTASWVKVPPTSTT